MQVALMGAGLMGSALSQAGHDVAVYNRSADKLAGLRAQGLSTSTGPSITLENADCVITMLSGL